RNDSEEEAVFLDWSKEPRVNLREILWHIVKKDGISKGQKLAYLNCFTKFCTKVTDLTPVSVGFTLDEIFCCLRVSLFHDSVEVRAAGFRAMRYLLQNEDAVESLFRTNIEYLICRSIDIMLDNKTERIQGLRLVRKLLSLNPKRFPSSIARCLVAIGKDGMQERDLITRTALATLSELLLLNPILCAECGGISAILDSILQGNQSHHISEALISSILYLLNSPSYRYLIRADQDLQHFVAPFTDCHFTLPSISAPKGVQGTDNFVETAEQIESKFCAAKNALISILRSWTGIIYLCRCVTESQGLNGLQSLIEMLHLPYAETRRHLMELIFELFYLPIPEYTDDFNVALLSSHPSTMQESWQLYDGFVASEGRAILSHISKYRQNLIDNYLAILLYAFIYYGVLDGLVSVITIPNSAHNSVRATILIGELLHLCSQILPPEIAQRCHSLPKLVDAATSVNSSAEQRNTATAAISNLHRFHVMKKHPIVPCSLYLDQLLQFCSPFSRRRFYNSAISKSKLRQYLRKEGDDEIVLASIKDSQVLNRDYTNWDWSLIGSILKWPGDSFKKFEDSIHKNFIKKLLNFYKPTSKLFSHIDNSDERGREYCVVGCHLIDFLLEAEESKAFDYIDEFLMDLGLCFVQITVENAPSNAILSPTRMLSTLSHSYFLFIGRLSNSNKGRKLLEKAGIYQYLLDLISLSSHEAYMKLIVSSLDYTQEGHFTRTLLTKVLTATSESARLYATNYMGVLLRAGVQDFRKWALELLAQQLCDKNPAVVIAAAEIMDEALESEENLESLIQLRPSLLHIGDRGLLLLIRYLSSINGFKFLSEANFLSYEIERWRKTFNFKYVKIVEDLLNETLTYHQRSEDGTYGRRMDRKNTTKKSAFVPPHLYGQLAKHQEGIQILLKEDLLTPIYFAIREADFSTEMKILTLKAALWAVGHVASSSLGFQLIFESEIISCIIAMAAQAPVLSIRGTCFYVLGLIASTSDGADYLKDFGWEAVRHSHNEKWPLVKRVDKMENIYSPLGKRSHTLSSSSAGTRVSDLFVYLSGTSKGFKSVDSFVFNESQIDEESDILYSSLPVLESEKLFRNMKKGDGDEQMLKPQKQLSRVSSLSPQHYSTIMETRPRSSSDCQQRVSNEAPVDIDDSDGSSGIWIKERSNESVLQSVGSSDLENVSIPKPEKNDSGLVYDSSTSTNPQNMMHVVNAEKLTPPMMQSLAHRRKMMSLSAQSSFGPRRKISDPLGFVHFNAYQTFINPRHERTESNESSGKSRSGSFADSTSGVSSCDSTMTAGAFGQSYFQKLSPIASMSSISNNTSFSGLKSAIFTHCTLPRKNSGLLFGSPTEPDSPVSFDSIPSAIDASGYATLRAIQRKRIESLGMHYHSFSSDDPLQNGGVSDLFNSDMESVTSSRKSLPEDTEQLQENFPTESSESQKYMGLCLPLTLEFLFIAPSDGFSKKLDDESIIANYEFKTHLEKLPPEVLMFNNGLELHNEFNCLSCCKVSRNTPLISIWESEDTANNGQIPPPDPSMKRSSSKRKLTLSTDVEHVGSSFTSSSSVEGGGSATLYEDSVTNHVLRRREILRCVTNLSASVAFCSKASEQGLLILKQKYPQAFQDICLYSEVSLHLASYGFRLPARRFLQELFLDLTFDQLYVDAEAIVLKNTSNSESAACVETIETVVDVAKERSNTPQPDISV
ncbi:rapamycin-insensitive companion of mTOR-like isoform X1, partial [Dinothrombium tinctorium]